ncbi:reverse transcriptase [Elysia marginata]|uniref:Reverse transcriptase n=1 Tax=Elysia marginata TaxID=1093978 RepID=A0AAV4FTV5_9GAST|nr:reverse transcriptase [Elysia marginata]
MDKTRGAQIRSRIKWIEEGEKCSKFFLSLEKSRSSGNTIHSITKENKDEVTSEREVLREIRKYYETLYKENTDQKEMIQRCKNFTQNLNIPQLKEDQKDATEADFTEEEISVALKSMKNGSAPGPDGIPVEFYKMFWPDVKEKFMEAFRYSQEVSTLSPSQRQGTITLIHKGKELSRNLLTNWRPICLTNADYKIISKALALRMKKVLPSIIHENQTGFIKGRNIATAIREIGDSIEFELINHKSEAIALSIAYSKAFDTVSVSLIQEALKLYGFGENFIKWVRTILTDRQSNVRNGGSCSEYFTLERGVRQGCPVSPMLFIIAVELLAINIRQSDKIRGIALPQSTLSLKILQFADDTTLFLKDEMDFREVLSKIKVFSLCSGLQLNEKKSKAMLLS